MSDRIVYVGTFPDGTQLMVERYVNRYGEEQMMTAATRPEANRSVVWGPPVTLHREES